MPAIELRGVCDSLRSSRSGAAGKRIESDREGPLDEQDLIYDWNVQDERWERPPFRIQFDDETLRDGLQLSLIHI